MGARQWMPVAALVLGVAVFLFALRRAQESTPPPVPPGETPAAAGTGTAALPPEAPREPVPHFASLPPEGKVREVLMMVAAGGWHIPVYESVADDPETRALLMDRLLNGETVRERSEALMVLALAHGAPGDEIVRAAARGDYGDELRTLAAIAAGRRPPERFLGILQELLDPSYTPDVNIEAYLRIFNFASMKAIDRFLTAMDTVQGTEEEDRMWDALLGERTGLTEGRQGVFEVPYEQTALWDNFHLVHEPDPAVVRRLLSVVASERGHERPVKAFAIAAAIPGEEGARAMWDLYERAGEKERREMITRIGLTWAPGRLRDLYEKAPDLGDVETRRLIAEKAGFWPEAERLPELKAWRTLEREPAVLDLLDRAIAALEPQ